MSGLLQPCGNPRKTRGIRKLGPVDVGPLRAAVLTTPEAVWAAEDEDKPNRFEVLSQTRHIVLRFIDSPRDWRRSHDRPAWPRWRDLVEPVLTQAVGAYQYRNTTFPRVMLARLPAGAVIQRHVDANPAALWPHKVHVPLTTNPTVISGFGGATHHFAVGEAVEVDNLGPHWVRNGGDTDRVHLIFECYDADQPEPSWLRPFLASTGP